MTFTTRIKEEITTIRVNDIESRSIIQAFLRYNANINEEITFTLENAQVARFIYKIIKEVYSINPSIIIRVQKRFRVKQIYMIVIKEKVDKIKDELLSHTTLNLDSDEERIAYLKGAFLGVANVSNPSTSGYHLEFILNTKKHALEISNLLNYYKLNSKCIKRGTKYITYIKMSECISDLIKMFKATNSLFEFEDTRIYRDHKNMVNRLNNCELANQEKTIKSCLSQLEDIKYLEENDLISFLDEKAKIVIEYRKKYSDVSLQELSEIISLETDYKVGKSGINHHFRNIKKIKENHLNGRKEK